MPSDNQIFVCINRLGEGVIRGPSGKRSIIERKPGESNDALGARAQQIARERNPDHPLHYISFEQFRDIASELEFQI